jgi:hypothetical protein
VNQYLPTIEAMIANWAPGQITQWIQLVLSGETETTYQQIDSLLSDAQLDSILQNLISDQEAQNAAEAAGKQTISQFLNALANAIISAGIAALFAGV